jgi:Tol biopolymer transport system component
MRSLWRAVLMVGALGIVLVNAALAVSRHTPGPSLLAWDTEADIALSWPGKARPTWVVQGPDAETNPVWSPRCCELAFLTSSPRVTVPTEQHLSVLRLGGADSYPVNDFPVRGVVWSPDGATLAVVASSGSATDIYLIRADGTSPYNLSDHPAYDFDPIWSPDGRQIAFISYRGGEALNNGKIFVATLDADRQVADLRPITDYRESHELAAWSPDGVWLLFTSALEQEGRAEDVFIARADGTELRPLTTDPARDLNPAWSPDGTWIAFESDRDGRREIYLIRPDGTGLVNLSRDPAWDTGPVWSPDGRWIAFESNRDGNREVYVIRPDGSGLRNLTVDPAPDLAPLWSPDGRWIVFESLRETERKVFVVRPDGSGLARVSFAQGTAVTPAWSPPRALAYHPLKLILVAAGLVTLAFAPELVRAANRAIMRADKHRRKTHADCGF